MRTGLLIGSNGGIAQALIVELFTSGTVEYLHTVSRDKQDLPADIGTQYSDKITHHSINSQNESEVAEFIATCNAQDIKFDYVISTVGVLHQNLSEKVTLKPEKRLEDIDPVALAEYFAINTIVPAIWLKHLLKVLPKSRAVIAFFSARVGSIEDNRLGGWYGYRASKSALNMLIKNASIEYQRRNKHSILVSYHPGTVATGLSKPFQSNVKPGKLFTPEFTAQCLIKQLQTAEVEESPYYVDWDGQKIPW
jgi:NAD(P)-dependent dehydrogenase (short-subunit alcohol dehydrogenase family)